MLWKDFLDSKNAYLAPAPDGDMDQYLDPAVDQPPTLTWMKAII